jgi:hypothetical protein
MNNSRGIVYTETARCCSARPNSTSISSRVVPSNASEVAALLLHLSRCSKTRSVLSEDSSWSFPHAAVAEYWIFTHIIVVVTLQTFSLQAHTSLILLLLPLLRRLLLIQYSTTVLFLLHELISTLSSSNCIKFKTQSGCVFVERQESWAGVAVQSSGDHTVENFF